MFSTADSESPRAANNGFARRSAYSKPGKIIRSHGEPLEVRAEQWLSNYGQSGSEPKYFLESRASLRPRNVRNLPEIPFQVSRSRGGRYACRQSGIFLGVEPSLLEHNGAM